VRLGNRVVEIFYRHKGPLPTIYGKEIRDHLSRYGNRRAIRVSFLLCFLVHQGELMAVFWRQLGGFHQNPLDVLIA
jgi:hypothetical protein